jgi:hypothetical protein
MYKHFSEIATSYRYVRTTDLEPIQVISQKLKDLRTVTTADVGCGDGRYSLLLFEYLNNLHLTSQNARNIWGRYFPHFSEKEDRLYEIDDVTEIVDSMYCISTESIKSFKFKRRSTLE